MKTDECIEVILGAAGTYLLLQLAIGINITKWAYFILVTKAHRNIRLFDINMDIFQEREGLNNPVPAAPTSINYDTNNDKLNEIASKKQTFKDLQLRKLKKNSLIVYAIFTVVAICVSCFYSFELIK